MSIDIYCKCGGVIQANLRDGRYYTESKCPGCAKTQQPDEQSVNACRHDEWKQVTMSQCKKCGELMYAENKDDGKTLKQRVGYWLGQLLMVERSAITKDPESGISPGQFVKIEDEIVSLLAPKRESVTQEWRNIDTAPRDESLFLLRDKKKLTVVEASFFWDQEFMDGHPITERYLCLHDMTKDEPIEHGWDGYEWMPCPIEEQGRRG